MYLFVCLFLMYRCRFLSLPDGCKNRIERAILLLSSSGFLNQHAITVPSASFDGFSEPLSDALFQTLSRSIPLRFLSNAATSSFFTACLLPPDATHYKASLRATCAVSFRHCACGQFMPFYFAASLHGVLFRGIVARCMLLQPSSFFFSARLVRLHSDICACGKSLCRHGEYYIFSSANSSYHEA